MPGGRTLIQRRLKLRWQIADASNSSESLSSGSCQPAPPELSLLNVSEQPHLFLPILLLLHHRIASQQRQRE